MLLIATWMPVVLPSMLTVRHIEGALSR